MLRFFLFCSGADTTILLSKQKNRQIGKAELYKFAGIGAIVFFTAVMAAISASYALYTIFEDSTTAIGFGLLWGLMIFNLDRFIVSTMKRKVDHEEYEFDYVTKEIRDEFGLDDEEEQIADELAKKKSPSQGLWVQAIPRLALAVIIAIVISKPLEMKIFEKEINQVLLEEKNALRLENKEQVASLYMPEINAIDAEIARLRNEVTVKEAFASELYTTFITEAEGTAGSGIRGRGPVFREKKVKYDEVLAELAALKIASANRIAELESQRDGLMSQMDAAIVQGEPVISRVDGLMARIRALDKLPKTPSMFILLLFLCVETAPILAKLLAPTGKYERWAEADEKKDKIKKILVNYKYSLIFRQKVREYQNLNRKNLSEEERARLTFEYLKNFDKVRFDGILGDVINDKEVQSVEIKDEGDDKAAVSEIAQNQKPALIWDRHQMNMNVSVPRETAKAELKGKGYDELGHLLGNEILQNQAIIEKARKSMAERASGQNNQFDIDDQGGKFTVDPYTLSIIDSKPQSEDEDEIGPSINNFYREMKEQQLKRRDRQGDSEGEHVA